MRRAMYTYIAPNARLDLSMPRMNGIEAARHIQASAPIPVVYMSTNADATSVERIQAAQAAGFVPKPIHYPTLHALLQRVLSGR